MATLTSTSTDDEVRDEFDNTASYHESSGSAAVSLAKRHITACRIWLARHPQSSGTGSHSFSLNAQQIEQSKKDAMDFAASNGSGVTGGVIDVGFREMRP